MSNFEEIYDEYYDGIYKFSLALCHNKEQAEDIVQETFLRAIKNIGSFNYQCKLQVWLCQIAKNYYYTVYKKNKRYAHYAENNFIKVDLIDFEIKLVNKEDALKIHRVLHVLTEPYKEVFYLRVFGELSFSEIGVLFEKSDSWARVTFYRAKLKIKEALT